MAFVDYDKLGHCAYCHKIIAEMINGQLVFFDRHIVKFKISDETKMLTSLCNECASLPMISYTSLMDSVVRGWEDELAHSDWSETKKSEYMNYHEKLEILERIES